MKISGPRRVVLLIAAGVAIAAAAASAFAQNESLGQDAGTCTLKDHVYTCDGAKFHQALLSAQTVAIQTHNADGVARTHLTDLITKKLNKMVAPRGTQADLVFLMVPIDPPGGVVYGGDSADLGTLRVYSSTQDGRPQHLMWAETYSAMPNIPWPAVVRALISKFQKDFQIK